MGISNVNNLNKIDLTKLNFGSKTVKTDNRPSYLKMTGSIFNAPGVSTNTNTLNDINTNKALSELKARPSATRKTSSKTTSNDKENTDISSASEGKAAAANANNQASKVKAQTSEMKSSEKKVQKYSADAKKQEKKAETEDKKFQQTLKAQEKTLKDNNLKLQKAVQENLETQTEITNAQNELDSLLGQSSFSAGGNNNSARIKELQTIIGTKSKLVQNNGKTIYSLQRSSNKTFKRMNKTNATYIKTSKRNMKNVAATQTKAAKVAQTAQKFEQIAAMVSQLGQTVNLAGKGLEALGHASFMSIGLGAVLIATGQVMQKVGTVVELVGNYGQTAASVTKGAAMAADGNLAGAMQAFGSAAATGAAAVKSTKGLKKTFSEIDKSAKEATKKLGANIVSKEKAKKLAEKGQLGGLTEKQMRKSIKSQLLANDSITTSGNWSKKQLKGYMDNMKDGSLIEAAADKARSTSATNTMAKLKEAGLDGKYKVTSDGKITDKVSGKEVTLSQIKSTNKQDAKVIKKAMKSGASSTVSNFQNIAKNATKTTQKFDFTKFSQSMMSTAAMLMATNSNNTQGGRGYVPQWDLANDATFQKIHRSNRAHRATVV